MDKLRFSQDLRAAGYTYAEVRRMTRAGELERVRRGTYTTASGEVDRAEAHRRLVAATMAAVSVDAAASHMSAAVVHGLPYWPNELRYVHVTRNRSNGGRVRRLTHVHASPLPSEDITVVRGLPTTSMARTVVDLCRSLPMERSVPIGDAALRLGLDPAELQEVMSRCAGWRGMAAARRAVAFLDRRSESVGESYSRVVFHQLGLPAPQPQFEVFDERAQLVGRCDFGWEEKRTLGEFDGKVKYGQLLKPGQTAGDVVFDEKRREDAMRDLGWSMVRWIWAELFHPADLERRLRRAFARSRL